MNHYTYAICNVSSDLPNVDFSEVITTSADTIRKSIDGTFFLIKWWTGQTPVFVTDGTVTPSQELNQTQCLALMLTVEWVVPLPI